MVKKIIEFLRAQCECGDNLMLVQAFARASDAAFLDKWQHAIGEHLGMNPKVLMVSEACEHRIGYRADA